jgi:hypothetical protein
VRICGSGPAQVYCQRSADLSRIGREAFQLQQTQEIRSAARVTGIRRRSTNPRASSRPSGSTVGGGASSSGSREDRGGICGGGRRSQRSRRSRRRCRWCRRRIRLDAMLPPFAAVGRAHQAWADIGASAWFGLQLPWNRKPQNTRARDYNLSPEDLAFARGEVLCETRTRVPNLTSITLCL